jgi:hypothetical protein
MELLKETKLSAQFKLKELPIKSNKVDQELNMFHSKKLSPPMIPSTKLIIFHMKKNKLNIFQLNIKPNIFHIFILINMLTMLLKKEIRKESNTNL